MTLIYEFDLDNMKMHLDIEMKFLGQCFQKLQQEWNKRPHLWFMLDYVHSINFRIIIIII